MGRLAGARARAQRRAAKLTPTSLLLHAFACLRLGASRLKWRRAACCRAGLPSPRRQLRTANALHTDSKRQMKPKNSLHSLLWKRQARGRQERERSLKALALSCVERKMFAQEQITQSCTAQPRIGARAGASSGLSSLLAPLELRINRCKHADAGREIWRSLGVWQHADRHQDGARSNALDWVAVIAVA